MSGEKGYNLSLGFCVALVGTLSGAMGSRFLERQCTFQGAFFMLLGGCLNMIALQHAPQSVVSPMVGFLVFWTAVITGRSLYAWKFWACIVLVIVGSALIVVDATHNVAKDPYNVWITVAVVVSTSLGIGIHVVRPTRYLGVWAAMQGGFAQTMVKALDIAIQRGAGTPVIFAYIVSVLAFAVSEFMTYHRALQTSTSMEINPVYTWMLNASSTLIAFVVYGEFHTDKLFGYIVGFTLCGLGTYGLHFT